VARERHGAAGGSAGVEGLARVDAARDAGRGLALAGTLVGSVGAAQAHHGRVAEAHGARVVPARRHRRRVFGRRLRRARLARVLGAPSTPPPLGVGVRVARLGAQGAAGAQDDASCVGDAAGDGDEAGVGDDGMGGEQAGVGLGLAVLVAAVAPAGQASVGGDLDGAQRVVRACRCVGEAAGRGVALAEAIVAPAEHLEGEGNTACVEEARP
jgi:hypothetical protein